MVILNVVAIITEKWLVISVMMMMTMMTMMTMMMI